MSPSNSVWQAWLEGCNSLSHVCTPSIRDTNLRKPLGRTKAFSNVIVLKITVREGDDMQPALRDLKLGH